MASIARPLLLLGGASFLVFGVAAFAWGGAVEQFPWTVGPFLAQTIGGWAIGTALIALYAAARRLPAFMYPLAIYLGLFGLFQLLVAVAFLDRLKLGGLLTYPYLLGLGAFALGAGTWALAIRAERAGATASAAVDAGRPRAPWWVRLIALLVGGFVLLLAIGTLIAGPDGATARGEVFPEPMGLFSIKAFSAFLSSLAAAILASVLTTDLRSFRSLGWSGLFLILPITGAALLHLDRFDSSKPATLVYLWAYIVVGVIIVAVLAYQRLRPQAFGVGDAT